ncbi:hypothetical protein EK21DRAFT_101128 [Setomelanomma holmii]|uniref:Rhodopsin domain-containing protein n=1 Tax=Setomelanomma holmii TaxID=210430 RepID=A0A9P4H8K9_9PLEO|nr:hypothetical protein EK21DRAFT_101128 [Setomelanomma holmii]
MAMLDDPNVIPSFPSAAAQHNARSFVATTFFLHIIALVAVFIVVSSASLLAAVPYTFRHDTDAVYLSDVEKCLKYAVVAEPLWAWSMATIKISFALILLRIEQARRWRHFLWAMIVILVFVGLINTITICLRSQTVSTVGVSVVNIITDFIFVLLPIPFLRKIQRPMREHIVVRILMGLSIFAGIASIVRTSVAARFGCTGDVVNESLQIGMWTVIEELIGIIVICVPCLHAPFQHAVQIFTRTAERMRRHGESRCYGRTLESNETQPEESCSRSRLTNTLERSNAARFKLEWLRPGSELSQEDIVQKPCEIWCTKEGMVDHDRLSRTPSYDRQRNGADATWVDQRFSLKELEMGRAM